MNWEQFLSSVESLGGTASGVIGAINGTTRPVAAATPVAATPAATPAKSMPSWIYLAGGGVLLLVVLVLTLGRRR